MSWVRKVWLGLCAIIAEAWERLRDTVLEDEDDSGAQEGAGMGRLLRQTSDSVSDSGKRQELRLGDESLTAETYVEETP